MLRFENVSRTFGNRIAVDRVNLRIDRGELYALLGHNGAGKTTSIKMLVGLLRPSSGDIFVGDMNVVERSREVSQLLGYVPDQPYLYEKLSGREFLRFVADMFGLPDRAARDAIDREIERFQLSPFVDQLTESYSHGMRQRTVFAASLIHEPELLVVDEPMVGLDPHSIRLVKNLLKSYAVSGKAVLMSTHTLEIAEQIADRVGVMKNGKIVFDGPMEQLRQTLPNVGASLESLYMALMDSPEGAEA